MAGVFLWMLPSVMLYRLFHRSPFLQFARAHNIHTHDINNWTGLGLLPGYTIVSALLWAILAFVLLTIAHKWKERRRATIADP